MSICFKRVILGFLLLFAMLPRLSFAQTEKQHLVIFLEAYTLNAKGERIPAGTPDAELIINKAKGEVLHQHDEASCVQGACEYTFEPGFVYFLQISGHDLENTNRLLDLTTDTDHPALLPVGEEEDGEITYIEGDTLHLAIRNIKGLSGKHDFFNRFTFERHDETFSRTSENLENLFLMVQNLQSHEEEASTFVIKAYTDDKKKYRQLGEQKARIMRDVFAKNGLNPGRFQIETYHMRDFGTREFDVMDLGRTVILISMKRF